MKILFIGATGYIGSHAARRLVEAGHDVTGFVRDDRGAAKMQAIGADAFLGDVTDLPGLCAQAGAADATIFSAQLATQQDEYDTLAALADSYAGTGKTLIFTSGTGVLGQRTMGEWSEDTFAEEDSFTPSKFVLQRLATEQLVRAAAGRNVRGIVLRPPMIWGGGYYGAIDRILESIEKTGAACYIGRGLNLYTNVHVDDLAELYLLALEKGTAGALYHAAGGELNFRTIAELVASRHDVPTRSITSEESIEIWDKFAMLLVQGVSSRSRSPRARQELGWAPVRLDLFEQILAGTLESRQRS